MQYDSLKILMEMSDHLDVDTQLAFEPSSSSLTMMVPMMMAWLLPAEDDRRAQIVGPCPS